MNRLSIIIVNTGTRELTRQCLESIYSNLPSCEFEVIVVDNASTDGSCEAIASQFPAVHLIRSNLNLGFCGANNLGFKAARGEHYLLLNNDTIVLPGSLDKLLTALEEDPTLGAVAPKLVYPDGSLQMSYGAMPGLFVSFCSFFDIKKLLPKILLQIVAESPLKRVLGKNAQSYVKWSSPQHPQTGKLDHHLLVTGACMLIRGACFQEVGLLDPNFFMYVDDADYCRRIYDAGWEIKYFAEAVIVHIKGGTVGQRYRWTSHEAYYSVFYFLEKHRGWIIARIGKVMALCSIAARFIVRAAQGSDIARDYWNLFCRVAEWPARSKIKKLDVPMPLEANGGQAAD